MIVIKIGGGEGINHAAVFDDVAELRTGGHRVVIVHGANHEMKVLAERLAVPQRMITSASGVESRYTDGATMDVFLMAYCGKVNKSLVALAQQHGINAIGLSGMDGQLMTGERKKALKIVENGKRKVIRDDLSGKIEKVNTNLLELLVDRDYVPLICPPALSEEHAPINVDGDRAAAMIAAALNAHQLIILSNVPGLLEDVGDESSLIRTIDRRRADEFDRFAKGRMKKKVLGAVEAIDGGVREVIFADARRAHPVKAALRYEGTVIR